MELDTICVSERMYSQLGADIVDVKTGNFKYRKNDRERYENIKYWVTDEDQHLMRMTESIANSIPNFKPSDIEYIHSVYSRDHGQKKLRFASKLLVKMKGQDVHWKVYPVGDADCKKDNGDIVKGTILPTLQRGISTVIASSMTFTFNESTKKWECNLVPMESVTTNYLDAFLCGDLKFLFMMLGREDFDTF